MKLYATPYSSNAEKVHFFLNEIGISYSYENVDLMTGANRTSHYTRQNSHQRVPSIEIGGFRLRESQAILRYLAARYERYDWYPVNLEERARIDAAMDFAMVHVAFHVGTITWERVFCPKLGFPNNPQRLQFAELRLPRELGNLEHALGESAFLCGHHPSLADACLLPAMSMADASSISLLNYPLTKKWLESMVARPAWQKVLEVRRTGMFLG